MTILKAETRTSNLKAKQLRRAGIVPGVIYGSRLDGSISIQFSQKDVDQFLRSNSIGSTLELVVEDKKHMALLKHIDHTTVSNNIEHLSFMSLSENEKVTNIAQIILLNREKALGNVQQAIFEISYKALPADLIDKIEVDLQGMVIGDNIRISDLEISKNEALEILDPPDNMVCSIVPHRAKAVIEETTPEIISEAEAEAE